MSRSRYMIDAKELTMACSHADIVISERWLPRTCVPKQLKADGRMLARTGGLSVVLGDPAQVDTVAASQGEHPWWRGDQ